jgi:hypothetical protein
MATYLHHFCQAACNGTSAAMNMTMWITMSTRKAQSTNPSAKTSWPRGVYARTSRAPMIMIAAAIAVIQNGCFVCFSESEDVDIELDGISVPESIVLRVGAGRVSPFAATP